VSCRHRLCCSSFLVLKPLKLQQNEIIRICLNKHSFDGSTQRNYLELEVLPVKLVQAKLTILWVKKNITILGFMQIK